MLIDGVPCASLPANDRGLAYGDGLFETIRICQGKALFLEEHLLRLEQGCARLALHLDMSTLRRYLEQALVDADKESILKLILTRGSGGRGYQPPTISQPRCIISLHPLPDYSEQQPELGIHTFVCKQTLAQQTTLAGIKHLNRLEQVLASMEFPDKSFLEGLMLDAHNNVIEGTRTNIFALIDGSLLTPDLSKCGVEGIMRNKLLELFGKELTIATISLERLLSAKEVFVVNSVLGIWPVSQIQAEQKTLHFELGHYYKLAKDYFDKVLAT